MPILFRGLKPTAKVSCRYATEPPGNMKVRPAQHDEIEALSKIWYDAWQDAHAEILPDELARLRTPESLSERMTQLLSDVRVIGDVGNPLGFSMTKDDELYQLYVSADARGKGVAKYLIAEVEERLAAKGVKTAWLACAIGNDRAARFYEKSGWRFAGNVINKLPLPSGIFSLEVWRYEKDLKTPSSTAR